MFEFVLNMQMETFPIKVAINLSEERKLLIAVTSLHATISVFEKLMETIFFPLVDQFIGILNLPKKLLTNYFLYKSLGLKMILNYNMNK